MEGKLIKTDTGNYVIETDKGILSSTFDAGKFEHKLSLTNCQAIERGYDLDELAKQYGIDTTGSAYVFTERMDGFKAGFQKALVILGDRKFTEEDVKKIIHWSTLDKDVRLSEEELFKSLQQTEWGVTFDPEEKDVEGRLILKRK